MKKSILLMAVLIALVSLCLVFASCDSGSSDSGDPTPVTYTISFDANGGSGTMNSEIVEAGTSYKIPENGFTEPKIPVGAVNGGANIPFVGWNTAADGTGTTYAVEGTIQATDITANITLYAQWAKPSFSVSATDKVYFSKGNLWYGKVEGATTATFNFEDNQYSFADSWNENHVSHFRCAANSGTLADDVASAISTETSLSGSTTVFFTNATEITARADFTVNGVTGKYRTLSEAEWDYLLNSRSDANRFAKANVEGVKGLLIFPDSYSLPYGYTTADGGTGMVKVNAKGTVQNELKFPKEAIPSDIWTAMEAAGCVFLPAAGYRYGSDVKNPNSSGYYWSATPCDDPSNAYYLYFNSSNVAPGYNVRNSGRSVRLVCGVN